MVVLLREIEIKGAANFLIVSILVFYEKNYLEKSHNNIKSERKLREKHLFCASLTEKVNWHHNPLHLKSLRSKST